MHEILAYPVLHLFCLQVQNSSHQTFLSVILVLIETWRSAKHGKTEASNMNICSYSSKAVIFKLGGGEISGKSLLCQHQPTATFQRLSSVKTQFNASHWSHLVYHFIKYIFQSFVISHFPRQRCIYKVKNNYQFNSMTINLNGAYAESMILATVQQWGSSKMQITSITL